MSFSRGAVSENFSGVLWHSGTEFLLLFPDSWLYDVERPQSSTVSVSASSLPGVRFDLDPRIELLKEVSLSHRRMIRAMLRGEK